MKIPHLERRCHWLRRNRASRRPEVIIFVDTEARMTDLDDRRVEHSLRLGWACLCQYTPETGLQESEWFEFGDPLSFWQWVFAISGDHEQLYIVAHNIAYDARLLKAFSTLPANSFAPNYAIMSESCIFFTFQSDKQKIHLLDNSNYWQIGLDQLGKEFGVAKGTVDFETATDAELSAYCRQDVSVLVTIWQFWLDLLDEHDLGDFAITAAGQAWNAYRHKFMKEKIGIHNRKDAIDLERASYRGGRVEVFRTGSFNGANYYKLDVNGLYAYVMQDSPHPQKLLKIVRARNPDELFTLMERWLAIADVIVDTDKPYYPYRAKDQNYFPVGVFRTQLATPELRIALGEGHLRAIGEVALYEPADLFSGYINTLTPLRQKYKAAGDTGRSLICKLLRNSLYGKFAQRGYRQEVLEDAPLDEVSVRRWVRAETGDRCVDWTFGGKTIRQYYEGESFDSFPAVSAHTAAYAREHMLMLLDLAGWENCLYMDTDSLIVGERGFQRLEAARDNLKLGHLKVEGVTTDLEILAKKAYRFGGQDTIKGVKKKAKRVGQDTYSQEFFTTLNYSFRSGDLGSVQTYQVETHLRHVVTNAIVGLDGVVRPQELEMTQDAVYEIVRPESSSRWTWWVDVDWLASLSPPTERLPAWILERPDWLFPEDV